MKILITGSNGFVAKHLTAFFKNHEIVHITRDIIDLKSRDSLDLFLKNKTFDVLFHTAIVGGRREVKDDSETLLSNVTMFYNILRHRDKFKKIIHFGSGAELDRITPAPGNEQFPIDPYGLSKNIIHRIGSQFSNIYNLRIFNVFGIGELPNRMIQNNINNYINKQPIKIFRDRLMDFFYIEDLCKIVEYCIYNTCPTVIDCVYKEKIMLTDIANIINNLSTYKVPIIIDSKEIDSPYIGDSSAIDSCNINLQGLYSGIQSVYQHYTNN